MSDFMKSFGRIFLFCTFLPGLTGFILTVILFPEWNLLSYHWYVLLGMSYGIGFVANAIGHGTEVLCESWHEGTERCFGYYWRNYVDLCNLHHDSKDRFIDSFDDAENFHCWYWNSACGIVVVMVVRFLKYVTDLVAGRTSYNFDCSTFVWIIASLGIATILLKLTCFLRKRTGQAVIKMLRSRKQGTPGTPT